MRRSYKFRLYPTTSQVEQLDRKLWLVRDFYNAALQERRDAWQMNRINVSRFDQDKQIKEVRQVNKDYLEIPERTLSQTLHQLDKVFAGFFRRIKNGEKPGYPRFKNRRRFNSIIFNREGWKLFDKHLRINCVGMLKMKVSRSIEGKVKEIILKREGLKWFAVLSCDGIPEKPLPATNQTIGIDVGIESFATLSDGTQIDNPRFFETAQRKLRIAQRRASRRKKGSNRRRKAVAQFRTIHQKILNCRSDFQHKLSTYLIQNYDLIAVEKLSIAGLAKGRLSKQILDASWSSFFHMLRYKAENAGRKLIEVDPRNTSQTCTCGEMVKKKLSVRWHHCLVCGLSNHRDIVSAQVILSRGLRDQALTYPVTESVA